VRNASLTPLLELERPDIARITLRPRDITLVLGQLAHESE